MVDLSVILVNYNERQRLNHVLRRLQSEWPDLTVEIIVIDNASTDGSALMVKQDYPEVRLIESPKNLMYGRGNNLGLQAAHGQWLIIMNVDVDWRRGQLNSFLAAAKTKPNIGLAGPRLINPAGRTQISAHSNWPTTWSIFVDYCLPLQQLFMSRIAGRLRIKHPYQESAPAHKHSHPVTHLTGTCLALPRATYEQVGGFENQFTMYLEETDWQTRIAARGLDRWLIGEIAITHFGSAAKQFAQASRHYLWGLELYTRRHWPPARRRTKILMAIWTAALVSDIFLLCTWPLSLALGRIGRRLRHYFRAYAKLTVNLLTFPTSAPVPAP